MKISNSKKQLAKIIHENGGWRDGMSFSWYGNKTKKGYFGELRPRFDSVSGSMVAYGDLGVNVVSFECTKLPNWRQTILSRDEYFHLYPALGELCGKVTEENRHEPVWTNPPSIEQLAADYRNAKDYADRKQQEADAAKADADAKLAELVAAGRALGLVLSAAGVEPVLAVTDWRDLREGDIIECIGSWEREDTDGRRFAVTAIDPRKAQVGRPIRIEVPEVSCPGTWGLDFKFISRPAKGDANA